MAGFVAYYNTNNEEGLLDRMLDVIAYRGPDYRLKYEDESINIGYVGLDLQYEFDKKEIFESDEKVVLLNGYVSNIDEIKSYISETYMLESMDLSPSEMISILHEKEGNDIPKHIKGGYVILIYDKISKEIIVIRDRFAVQPVVYYRTNNGYIIASEAKSLLEHPDFVKEFNENALLPYLIFQSPTLKETFFKGVFTLPPASISIFRDNAIETNIYWDIVFEETDITLEQATSEIDRIVGESIANKTKYFNNKEMIGQSLSGGVDSSYLAARFRPKKTFTVGYNDKEFSEIDNAKALSDIIGAEHISEVIDSDKSLTELERIVYLCDMPFANLSAIPMYYLSKRVSEHTHAVLSGEGADEFFGGYHEYTDPKYMNIYKVLPEFVRKAIGNRMLKNDKDFKGKNFLIKGLPTEDWYIGQAKIFHENEAINVLKPEYTKGPKVQDIIKPYYDKVKDKTDIQKKQYLDFHVWMVNDIDLKADRMNIGNSVQLITPLLDEDLLEFARKLPDSLKIDGNKVKIAFRNSALKHLPEDWAKRKKKGYVVPVRKWLKEEKYSKIITDKLTGETAQKFFNVDELKELIEQNLSGKRAQHRKLWTIYMFLLWYDEYFIKR